MPTRRPPNIILTIADDQRGTALGCGGIEPVLTPALDSLAARGVRFAQAQHLGSCHGAVCAPSRAMLHTGVPYFHLDGSLLSATYSPEDRAVTVPPTLGQKLRGAGYHSFATGKWHNGVHSFHPSFDSGANLFFGGMADHWFTPVRDFDPSGRYPAESCRMAEGFSTEVFAQSAIDFIQSRRGEQQPFFCYCAFTAPHDPRTPPDAWRRRYNPSAMPLPPNISGAHYRHSPLGMMPPENLGLLDVRDELLLGLPRDLKEVERSIAEYYGMISHMDEWIGRIHQAVSDIGEMENTIIIHTADHGLAVGQHGLMGKQNLFQHSVNVPLLLAGPEIPAGVVSDGLCYQHDLHPTLMEATGAAPASGYFQSLLPALRKESGGRTHIASAFGGEQRCVRDERYKLIELNIDGARSSQLFDLAEDRWETRNLGADPAYRAVVETLRGELRQWQKATGDDADWRV